MSGIHLALLGMNFGPGNTTVEYLVVAGGGGAAGDRGGGGGAGGYRTDTGFVATFGTAYTVTVGAGGNGSLHSAAPTSGNDSVFSSITSTGGGHGARAAGAAASGGSGGGGAFANSTGGMEIRQPRVLLKVAMEEMEVDQRQITGLEEVVEQPTQEATAQALEEEMAVMEPHLALLVSVQTQLMLVEVAVEVMAQAQLLLLEAQAGGEQGQTT
jgi:hypothetical protein